MRYVTKSALGLAESRYPRIHTPALAVPYIRAFLPALSLFET
mgnify:CR=1 FL=1